MLFCILLTGCAGSGAPATNVGDAPPVADVGTLIDPPKPLADFTLNSHEGAPLSLGELRGRPVLLFFGFTHCPDVCPLTLTEWKKIKQQLGDAAADVAFVFISVDGERDTPDVLARYVTGHDPSFIGLTGDEPALRAAAKEFGVFFHVHDAEGGDTAVDHTPNSFLLNRAGQLRVVYSYGIPAKVISADIRTVLNEG